MSWSRSEREIESSFDLIKFERSLRQPGSVLSRQLDKHTHPGVEGI